MNTYRIIREYDVNRMCYFWFAYKVTLLHRLFGPPFGYIGDTCSITSAQDCEYKLRRYTHKEKDKVEWEVRL